MASEKFIKAEAAEQTAFATLASSGFFQAPVTAEFSDEQVIAEAVWDQGTWTPTEIVDRMAQYAEFTTDGSAFFEMLPVYLSAGFADAPPVGSSPYSYEDLVSFNRVGGPAPYTWLFGSRTNIGGTGPAVRIQDSYCQEIVIAGNINSKEVTLRSSWFGLSVDDNSDAGYAMNGSALPTSLGMLKTLLGAIAIKDAGATGNSFASMTSITNTMLDWTLTMRTGLEPLWVSDGNAITYAGVRYTEPEITFAPVFRVDSTIYPLVRAKADDRTYQELQLTLTGDSSRSAVWKMTGRWSPEMGHVGRSGGEQVISPTFMVDTPHTQTSGKHLFGWDIDTLWSHAANVTARLVEDGTARLTESGSPRLLG